MSRFNFDRRKRIVTAALGYGASALHWLADILSDLRDDVQTWKEDDDDER